MLPLSWEAQARSLKSGPTAPMGGGPKGGYCIFWSPQNHCSVPQIPLIVPRKQLFCPFKFQIICRPPTIIPFLVAPKIIQSPQIPSLVPILGFGGTEAVFIIMSKLQYI